MDMNQRGGSRKLLKKKLLGNLEFRGFPHGLYLGIFKK